jgi:hypothetical protein
LIGYKASLSRLSRPSLFWPKYFGDENLEINKRGQVALQESAYRRYKPTATATKVHVIQQKNKELHALYL